MLQIVQTFYSLKNKLPASLRVLTQHSDLFTTSAARLGFALLAVCGFQRSAFMNPPRDPSVINRLMSQSEAFIFAANRK